MEVKIMKYKFCPDCGGKCEKKSFEEYWCGLCGKSFWDEPDIGAAVLVHNPEKGYLFIVEKKEPSKGLLGLPAGYVDNNETLEEGAIRECREETGIEVSDLKYSGSNIYQVELNGVEYKGVTAFFTAETRQYGKPNDSTEVEDVVWLKKEEIVLEKIGSVDSREFIRRFLSLFPSAKQE